MKQSFAVPITESSQVGELRRMATGLAKSLNLPDLESSRVALVATELGNNLAHHTAGGQVVLRSLEETATGGIEVLSIDSGPGISNIGQSLKDGFSTGGTQGTGLGAVRRLSSHFDIYSAKGQGTVVCARIQPEVAAKSGTPIDIGAISVAKKGETECGDIWSMAQNLGRVLLTVADGLGHGSAAADASGKAARAFEENIAYSPANILGTAHAALRETCGAVMAVAEWKTAEGTVEYAGIGNIAGSVVSGEKIHHMVSLNGTVGHAFRTARSFFYDFPKDAYLVLHSDGLISRWSLDSYPGLLTRHPSIMAALLYRDFNRGNDDITVLAARVGSS